MDKKAILKGIGDSHLSFITFLEELSSEDFLKSKNVKWTPGQHLEHICLSVRPLRMALGLPKFVLRLLFGKANRESKGYDELVRKYRSKLVNGGKASKRFVPKKVGLEKKHLLMEDLKNEVCSLVSKIDKWNEEELDEYILPHPLLGKVTLREMLYFTIYHVGHHQESVIRNL